MSLAASSRRPAASASCAALWFTCAKHPAKANIIRPAAKSIPSFFMPTTNQQVIVWTESNQVPAKAHSMDLGTAIEIPVGVLAVEERDFFPFASNYNRRWCEGFKRA